MVNKNCGCENGRTIIIDPNRIEGQGHDNNFVRPEDLSILVELTTRTKHRSVLINTGDSVKSTDNEDQATNISFIKGSIIDGKDESLSTRYTDYSTVFKRDAQYESLGITNIDIDFSSSYAPMITINFVDVRGQAMLQDPKESPFRVFYELPYPMFELTVKGYYGKAVKYCLHLTKFNSKFNSQTGNFEIVANFVGYTYAMLSDILIGFLRWIPETSIGRAKFENVKKLAGNEGLITLNELIYRAKEVNSRISQLKSDNESIKKLAEVKNLSASATELREIVTRTFTNFTDNSTIMFRSGSLVALSLPTDEEKANQQSLFDDYQTRISEKIDAINKDSLSNNTLNVDDFKLIRYENMSINEISGSTGNSITELNRINGISADKTKIDEDRYRFLNATNSSNKDARFNAYDFTKIYLKLSELDKLASDIEKNLKIDVNEVLNNEVTHILGVEPSIRNIFTILTTHVEIFLECIYDVSRKAEDLGNKTRLDELKQVVTTKGGSYDLSAKDAATLAKVYPWPEYRKPNATTGTLEEAWLGDDVPNWANVDELNFIEELLAASLKVAKQDVDVLSAIANDGKVAGWYPVNPMDTPLFGGTNPYKLNTPQDDVANTAEPLNIFRVALARAFTYLGVTNKETDLAEIKGLAILEARNAANSILNNITKQMVRSYNTKHQQILTTFQNGDVKLKTPVGPVAMFYKSGDNYVYDYIDSVPSSISFTGSSAPKIKILPINKGFNGEPFYNITTTPAPISTTSSTFKSLNQLQDTSIDGYNFISDYNTAPFKAKDGGIFVKIFSKEEYLNGQPTFAGDDTDVIGDVNKALSSVANGELTENTYEKRNFATAPWSENLISGYKPFQGAYRIQEFSTLDYNGYQGQGIYTNNQVGPLFPYFYQNTDVTYNKLGTNLLVSRKVGSPDETKYDRLYGESNKKTTVSVQIYAAEASREYVKTTGGDNRIQIGNIIEGKYENVSIPNICFTIDEVNSSGNALNEVRPFSLFGSLFYFAQSERSSFDASLTNPTRALLFLHSLPWNGLYDWHDGQPAGNKYEQTPFNYYGIRNLFAQRAGFVNVPVLWAAFVGGMLWRATASRSGSVDPIIFSAATIPVNIVPSYNFNNGFTPPSRYEYLTAVDAVGPFEFNDKNSPSSKGYKSLDTILLNLPEQVKEEFIEYFLDFVGADESANSRWNTIRSQLEIHQDNWTWSDWRDEWENIDSYVYKTGIVSTMSQYEMPYNAVDNLKNVSNYNGITPLSWTSAEASRSASGSGNARYNYQLDIYEDAPIMKELLTLFGDNCIIANNTFRIWQGDSNSTNNRSDITVRKNDLDNYMKFFLEEFVKVTEGKKETEETNQIKESVFGSSDSKVIKLNLYRTIKSIYDKWVGGALDNDIVFQCGKGRINGVPCRNPKDTKIAEKYGRTEPRLIDSFRFVNRAFNDIGDRFYINPIGISDYIMENLNTSFYDLTGKVMAENNFDFIALPSFINYNDAQELQDVFRPISYKESVSSSTSGPAFVCVYVGQTSNKLDLGDNAAIPNDGFDFKCDGNNLIVGANDFATREEKNVDAQTNVAVFAVNYGSQNQNIFKDIRLDQQEFTETAESLQITDDIAQKKSQNDRTLGGQNLFNVYQVRSYKAEVEMMGNAMIQPMMYFQLNNIPMFHGAYLITKVKHSIEPNSMSTTFSGVRIRAVDTPLIESDSLYMSLLGSLTEVNKDGSKVKLSKGDITAAAYPKSLEELKGKINEKVFESNKTKFKQYE